MNTVKQTKYENIILFADNNLPIALASSAVLPF